MTKTPQIYARISTDSVNFLDTTILKDEQGYINTDVYQKPTDTHPYLHWTSAHPPRLKRSIPYSQGLRMRQVCSSTGTLRKPIIEYSDFFVACGYERGKVLNEIQSSNTDSRGVSTDQGTAAHAPISSCYYIKSSHNIYCRSCKTQLELSSIKGTISTSIQQTTPGCI